MGLDSNTVLVHTRVSSPLTRIEVLYVHLHTQWRTPTHNGDGLSVDSTRLSVDSTECGLSVVQVRVESTLQRGGVHSQVESTLSGSGLGGVHSNLTAQRRCRWTLSAQVRELAQDKGYGP